MPQTKLPATLMSTSSTQSSGLVMQSVNSNKLNPDLKERSVWWIGVWFLQESNLQRGFELLYKYLKISLVLESANLFIVALKSPFAAFL